MRMIGEATVPGAFLCDLLPPRSPPFPSLIDLSNAFVVKYLPSWIPFKQHAKKGQEMIERLVTKPYKHVIEEMVRRPTFSRSSWVADVALGNRESPAFLATGSFSSESRRRA